MLQVDDSKRDFSFIIETFFNVLLLYSNNNTEKKHKRCNYLAMVAWSRKWRNLKFTTWNCFSLSKERYDFCKWLNFDILALTELHNKQNKFPHSQGWIPSACAGNYETVPKQGKYTEPATGVTIMLSKRMAQDYRDSGHVGTRIVWVRVAGPL